MFLEVDKGKPELTIEHLRRARWTDAAALEAVRRSRDDYRLWRGYSQPESLDFKFEISPDARNVWSAKSAKTYARGWVANDDETPHPAAPTSLGVRSLASSRFLGIGLPEPVARDLHDYGAWEFLHPRVREHAEPRFREPTHADAVEAACKALIDRVRTLAPDLGFEKSDTSLMRAAFNGPSPVIAVPGDDGKFDPTVQEGYGHMFAGFALAIRNPKAHRNHKISAETALGTLQVISHLMIKLDEAEKLMKQRRR